MTRRVRGRGRLRGPSGRTAGRRSAYWPEFAQNGEDAITVLQLLSHQAELAALDEPIGMEALADPDLGIGGLFEVVDGIYQVRNLDLSNISCIRGESGWIVLDPLITAEVAAAALELVNTHVERRPVTAVVYSHSHADHFGGVRGVCTPQDVVAGRVRIVAPEGFTVEPVSENVMAGNARSRRASYMYGNLLPPSPTGQIGAGLCKTTSTRTFGLLEPTDIIGHDDPSIVLDGIEFLTLYTPDTEAPAEFVFLLPAWGALWSAEVVTHVQHDLYTLRGAQIRDALGWAKAIDAMIARFGAETELIFASHHWPTWGHDASLDLLRAQRDTYRYLRDPAAGQPRRDHARDRGTARAPAGTRPHLVVACRGPSSMVGYRGHLLGFSRVTGTDVAGIRPAVAREQRGRSAGAPPRRPARPRGTCQAEGGSGWREGPVPGARAGGPSGRWALPRAWRFHQLTRRGCFVV